MKMKRRFLIENLETRIVMDGVGPNDPPGPPAWESVIVTWKNNVGNPRAAAQGLVNAHGGQLGHVYEHAVRGFSALLPQAAVQALQKNPQIDLIEPDMTMQAFGQVVPTGVDRINADFNAIAKIDGIDERVDVDIAIIDSGIDSYHPDLNVVNGRRFYTVSSGPPKNRGSFEDGNFEDDNGHGSHVAGIAAALDNNVGVVGVAPGARLWAVKVLNSNNTGSLSNVIAGIDWVTANAADIEIANMSLGGQGASTIYHNAIKASVGAGVVYVVASGNEYRDILGTDFQFGTFDDTIPAAYPEVATISAFADTDGRPGGLGSATNFQGYPDDTYADISNYSNSNGPPNYQSWYDSNNKVVSPGLGIDLMMPGIDIYSTYKNGGYATISGTSMAAPHAAGLAALYIAEHGRATNATEVYAIRQALIDGGKAWTSPEGLQLPSPPTPNPDSPDNHIENLGWAADSAATPGITVSPTAGLVTSEDLGTDTFSVVLNTQPTADVTIAIASSNLAEGVVDRASLTFTVMNWNTPQIVTVTGVNDEVADGDVPYSIITSPAISNDVAYNGFNPLDVSVTNIDNDIPPHDPNTLYVYDITFDSRRREKDWRAVFEIRSDSNADGQGGAADNVAAGVTITVSFAGQTYTGTTDSNGIFRTNWVSNLRGGDYYANAIDLALTGFVWNPLDLDLENDSDMDQYPDQLLTI